MKVFVTGISGQLGHDVMNELNKQGIKAVGSDLNEGVALDLTDEDEVRDRLLKEQPDAIIHCAAWTAVDAAEDEDKKELVYAINAKATETIAATANELDAKMIYLSTDYIFDGQGETPWKEDCKDYAPQNYYGETKLEGEKIVQRYLDKFFIVRIAWVFGINGNNFVKTMLKVGKNHDVLTVVNDQIGTPTYTYDLAMLLVDMVQTDKYGIYHATNEGGFISWYDFAEEIFRIASIYDSDLDAEHLQVKPVTTAEYGVSKAKRPFNSRLCKDKLVANGFEPLPDWKDALQRYIDLLYRVHRWSV